MHRSTGLDHQGGFLKARNKDGLRGVAIGLRLSEVGREGGKEGV